MDLTRHLVKQFVEITNDSGAVAPNTSLYGTIIDVDGTKYAKIDGAEELTPIVSTVDIKVGDRVTIELKNHVATVTGNLSDPSASGEKLHQATITIDEMGIKLTGFVTFQGLANGTTTIDGSCIKTGTIDAARLNITGYVTEDGLSSGTTIIDGGCIQTGTIDADRLNLTGAITFSDLSSSVQKDIEDAYDLADDAYGRADTAYDLANDVDDTVYAWSYNGGTYIDGSMIKAGTVMAGKLLGGTVGLLNSSEDKVGVLSITGSSSSSFAIKLESGGALALRANNGDIDIDSNNGGRIILTDVIKCYEDTRPSTGAAYTLGTSSYAWKDGYFNNEPTVTSDRNAKKEIEYGLSRYDEVFDALKPVSFKYVINDSDRRHLGLIAQDVENTLNDKGVSSKDFAPFIKSPKHNDDGVIEGEYDYALRYGELIALCIEQIQTLKARVAQLENQNGIQ